MASANRKRFGGRMQTLLRRLIHLHSSPSSSSRFSLSTPFSSSSSSSSSLSTPSSFSPLPLCTLFPRSADPSAPQDVPQGCLAVYVGREQKRFVIPAPYLNRPAFRLLLEKAKEEYGFSQKGGLNVPCEVFLFERFLHLLRMKEDSLDFDQLRGMSAPDLEKYYSEKFHLAFKKVSMDDDDDDDIYHD